MNPLIRLHSIALSITTLIVFYLWRLISTVAVEYPNLKILIAVLISIGIFRLVLTFFKDVLMKIRFIKKWIFGPSYLEGVWVGFFIGRTDKERFYIETFEQDFNSITIRGDGYKEDEGYFGSWTSKNVHFDVRIGSVSYLYETKKLKSLEFKISDVPNVKDVNVALKKAKEFYEKNKTFTEMI